MTAADELLAQAKAAYWRGQEQYRDSLLETGRLLHEYILAFLHEGDGMTEGARLAAGITRRKAITIATEALGTKKNYVNNLIATTMAAKLLGDGNFGQLGIQTIYQFRRFVRRRTGRGKLAAGGRSGIPVSDAEQFEVKPQFDPAARELFRCAVAENWNQQRARIETVKLLRGEDRCRRRTGPTERTAIETLQKCASRASPGDVAEMCLELVGKADDPAAVAVRLQVLLQRFQPKKRRVI